ncbi:major facilitator superfamily domain-containing protein [Blastocladiella britannica]|nr:major facilitator superfamily domain-containing protein [Blastocladiella britannica]
MRDFYTIASTYLAFTVVDAALRMLVLLELFTRHFTAIELALMFTLYEVLGVVTNLFGGLAASRIGFRPLLLLGLLAQIVAISMLYFLDSAWSKAVTTIYVAISQGFSGIAKDLVKMSGKSVSKLTKSISAEEASATLLRLVTMLTGAKNSIKGLGYFIGALLITWGYFPALTVLLVLVVVTLALTFQYVAADLGKSPSRLTLHKVLTSQSPQIRQLSLARVFLFGARDLWFEVPLPVFLRGTLGWPYFATGFFLAAWIMVYGGVQSSTPAILRAVGVHVPDSARQRRLADPHSPRPLLPIHAALMTILVALASALTALPPAASSPTGPTIAVLVGLSLFAVFFAMASSLHSYLIVAYSGHDKVAANVGIYYCANSVGRLSGTLASGYLYVNWGLSACVWFSLGAIAVSGLLSIMLEDPASVSDQVEEDMPLAPTSAAPGAVERDQHPGGDGDVLLDASTPTVVAQP